MTAEDLKAQGNKHFSKGEFPEAIKFFSQAIELDSTNHVLFSNRSASYASLRDYVKALDDAEKTVELNPAGPRYKESVEAYQAGLALEPSNTQMQKGLKDAEAALADLEDNGLGGGGFGKLFAGDVFSKIASNPKLASYLAQPDFVQKVRDCQANPKAIEMYMNDPRMMSLVFGLMGIDASATSDMSNLANMDEDIPVPEPKARSTPAEKPAPKPEPEVELDDEEKEKRAKRAASDKEKEAASAAYKKRDFETALKGYDKAFELDETNIAVLTNKSAVLFEMGQYDDCIKVGEDAIEKGRELRADFKLIARAFGRIGSAYLKKNDHANAIKFYQKSLSEHRTPDILTKLRDVEKLKEKADKEAYRSIPLADEAREKGNQLFKESKYAEAVPLYTEAIKRNDQDPRNYSNRAACYTKLMAFAEAERDCDSALKLDENFVKAYIRKAAILHAKKDYMKAIEVCQEAKAKDVEGKHGAEIEGQIMKCYAGLNEVQRGENKEETLKRAMSDPEVQRILGDPVMQSILQQMKEDPAAAADHMKNPAVAAKIRVLINAGVIQMR
ncbi:chaperone [Chytridium lagenaria]|nr:chaperone [Chytridium lagenaria]